MSESAAQSEPGRELYVRRALVNDHSVVLLRAIDHGDHCRVEVDVWPSEQAHPYDPKKAGSYTFPSEVETNRFVTHAVEAFIVLGCEVRAS